MSHTSHLMIACLIVGALAITLEVAPAEAQSIQTIDEATAAVNRLLQSSDAKEVAWGAFTAAQYHVVSAVPLLIAALQRDGSPHTDLQGAAEFSILDALVQLHAQVPAEVLRTAADRWRIPALILLENATGDRDGILLQRLSVTTGFEWQAIANLLFRSEPPGLAFRLVDGLRLRLTVYVTDQPNVGFGSGLGEGSETGCMATTPEPRGLPPLADYRFAAAGPGATILSIGPDTVYYARVTATPPVMPCNQGGQVEHPSDVGRVKYLNALAGPRVAATVPLLQSTSATVRWSNADRFRLDVSRERQVLEDRYQNVVSLLLSTQHLTKDERRTLTHTIAVTVEDMRKDKSQPLPVLDRPPI